MNEENIRRRYCSHSHKLQHFLMDLNGTHIHMLESNNVKMIIHNSKLDIPPNSISKVMRIIRCIIDQRIWRISSSRNSVRAIWVFHNIWSSQWSLRKHYSMLYFCASCEHRWMVIIWYVQHEAAIFWHILSPSKRI